MKLSDGHEWTKREQWTVCKKCGIIKRKDGKNKQCRGTITITTRSTKAELLVFVEGLLSEITVLKKDRDDGWTKFYETRKQLAEIKFPGLKGKVKTLS